jgi:pimeloyl-ACP methyl ester carboxylesterase
MVAIERPGWNRSSFEDYRHLSFAEQGEYLEPLLRQLAQDGPLILVGHSYGASLVVGLSMLYPDIPAATVAIAGDLTPAYREPRWYNRLADTGLVYWLLPTMWKGANDEVLALHDEMAALQDQWQQLETPVWVIQGDKDSLVDKRNAEFAKQLQTAGTVEVLHGEDFGHVVHITHYEMVNQLLYDVIDTVTSGVNNTNATRLR